MTLCNVTCAYPAPEGEGTSAQAFAADSNQALPGQPVAAAVDRGPAVPAPVTTAASTAGRARRSPRTPTPGRWAGWARQHGAIRLEGHAPSGREARGRLAGRRRAQRQGEGPPVRRLGAAGDLRGEGRQRPGAVLRQQRRPDHHRTVAEPGGPLLLGVGRLEPRC